MRLEAEIAQKTEDLKELALDPAALDALKLARDARHEQWQTAHETWVQARIDATARDERVSALRQAHATAVAEHEEIARHAALLRVHDVVASILTGYRDHQRLRAWPHLERAAGELLAATTDGRYADVRFDEDDCRLTIVDRGEPHAVGRYSGGEQDLANLCLRLAIAEWVSEQHGTELDFVVLDEVFGSQDENRRERLIDTLNGLGERFRQVFVVTHVDDIAERCDSQIDVSLEEPGRSTATLVSPVSEVGSAARLLGHGA
jgi:DNA repair protein SbcC/Rad50